MLRVAESVQIGSTAIDLLGQGNLWIEDSLADDSSLKMTQHVIQQALAGTHPGQLEVVVFDDALSGLSAPFEPLNGGGERLLSTVSDPQEFGSVLVSLRNHVQGVKRVMQGLSPTLVSFRRSIGYPVEGYKLVVLSTDVSILSEEAQNQLSILLKAGPAAGVSFVVHSTTLGANPFLVRMCTLLQVKNRQVRTAPGADLQGWVPAPVDEMISTASAVADSVAAVKLDPIEFTEVQPLTTTWGGNSTDGITFAVGRYGLQTVEVTLGDELNQRHNMLITGAVGQGKSNLISVMIHSLCQRYSPDELELYLLDFKEGVTLSRFADRHTGEYLPHARVLGLDADREFGLGLFQHLFALYRERMRLFKESAVQGIRQYREASPGERMPRIVVVIDEFQMMFAERDRISDQIADLLVKAVRLFRACGIHIVLASQTIGGNAALMGSTGEGLFGQVPVRIALKNSLAESQATLGVKNDAAAHLRAREAIVNLDYGEVSANRKTTIAFADEGVVAGLRQQWWSMAHTTHQRPFVFEGEQRRSVVDDRELIEELAEHPGVPTALLGAKIAVGSLPMMIPLSREVGRNVAILGGGEALRLVQNVALGLAGQSANRPTQFIVLDGFESAGPWHGSREWFVEALQASGSPCRVIEKQDVGGQLVDILPVHSDGSGGASKVVLGLGMDRFRDLPSGFADLCRQGPPSGVHVIGWWVKLDTFRDQVGYGGESYFDAKVALHLDPGAAKQFFGDPLLEWRPADNRALVWDSAEAVEPSLIIPYSITDHFQAH